MKEAVKWAITTTPFLTFDLDFGALLEHPPSPMSLSEFLKSHGAEEDLIRLLECHGFCLYGSEGEQVPMLPMPWLWDPSIIPLIPWLVAAIRLSSP